MPRGVTHPPVGRGDGTFGEISHEYIQFHTDMIRGNLTHTRWQQLPQAGPEAEKTGTRSNPSKVCFFTYVFHFHN